MDQHIMKKKFGQNFLTDKNLLQKIVNSAKIDGLDVIEIGPGQGALTNYLVLQAKTVTAYEVDNDLKDFLYNLASKHDNLTVNFMDILEVDLPNDKEYHVVANIPYNITSPIIFKLLESDNIKSATLMVQKEVCDRITASPGSKIYGALSVIIQYYMDVSKLMNVNRKLFHPVPKVDSAVFKMSRREATLNMEQEQLFLQIVKGAFHQKRKTILNNLSFSLDKTKEDVKAILDSLNIESNLRAENLFLEDFIKITLSWSQKQ